MTLKVYIGKTPVEKIFLGASKLPKMTLGNLEFSPKPNNLDSNVVALFAGGKQGAWYDPSDKSTLFQDVAGTIPVTKDGDPVGLILDKSQGLEKEILKTTLSNLRGWLLDSEGVYKANKSTGAEGGLRLDAASPLVIGRYYTITFDVVNYLSGYVKVLQPFDSGFSVLANSNGSYTFSGFATTTNLILLSVDGDMTISNVVITETKGNHAKQTISAARPLSQTDGTKSWLYNDKVDDKMLVILPSMTATVVMATDDGVTINYPVSVEAGNRDITSTSTLGCDFGRLIIDRELTADEKTQVTAYFNTKRGA